LAVIEGDVWERETVDLLTGSDPAGDIVHAGTFFGDFVPALARSRGPGAKVWAFEPNTENYRCAQVTVLLNDLSNVVLTNAALDADVGEARLAVRSADGLALGGGSYLVGGDAPDPNVLETQGVRLATIDGTVPANRRVVAIHLDVEGHEAEALLGATQTIERCRPLLVLEVPPDDAWFATHLPDCGYTAVGRVCENTILRPAGDERSPPA
jgi:FkbM family methyltransferase